MEKIDAVDLRRGKVPDEMRDSGDPVEVCVVGGEEDAVGRGVDIGLHPVHTGPSRGREGGQRVLARLRPAPAPMRNDLRLGIHTPILGAC
ncbi:Uncharacterised protein [Mycobacteroides abscessus subsp. abscessus]|nr:Uncharacterised protein [Mycobacteroides abscessus subsp. abscessus]